MVWLFFCKAIQYRKVTVIPFQNEKCFYCELAFRLEKNKYSLLRPGKLDCGRCVAIYLNSREQQHTAKFYVTMFENQGKSLI